MAFERFQSDKLKQQLMKCRLPALLIFIIFAGGVVDHAFKRTVVRPAEAVQSPEGPPRISVCQLKSDPVAYNHRLVEVTGFVTHGFENFHIFDPACDSWPDPWLEYGGTTASGTMYCCGVTTERSRPQPLVVEGITIDLVDDARLKEFDKLILSGPDSVVHATIVGRFFAGELITTEVRSFWGGYGHMGCCPLLAIQQIVSVDPRESNELDYGAEADQPNLDKECTGYEILNELFNRNLSIKAQERADLGQEEWAFSDPQLVATEGLAQLLKLSDPSTIELKQTRQRQGRIIYWWKPEGKTTRYMVVVSRPYLLSFYAKDPKRVAWVLIGAYETSCGGRR
jgi:hypothetical protein